jgi:ADP-ribose pyrophosphatase YjhB (NUDIX family)
MTMRLRKYWSDILKPAFARGEPPTIPQAVVLRGREVLLVKRDSPALWEIPGGGIRAGETMEDTAHREVEEETAVRIEIVRLLGWYDRTGFRRHRSPTFICRPLHEGQRRQTEDVVDARYFPLTDLPRAMFPWHRSVLAIDLDTERSEPLRRRQHIGLLVVLECLWLDLGTRLGLIH